MTRTELLRSPAAPPEAGISPARRALRALAILACVPYIALKTAWVAGSEIGIPAGSALLEHRQMMIVANAVSVVADALVVVLALLLTRPWGRRVPAWLLVLPMWAATGLLAPIMTGYPAQLAVALLTGGEQAAPPAEPFLHSWVFAVVYGGFILQGLSLGTLFVLYARDRWGRLLRARLGEPAARTAGPGVRAVALAATAVALVPLTLHTMWLSGATEGLSPRQAAGRDADFAVLQAQWIVFLLVAVAATLLLVLRRPAPPRTRALVALAWTGSGAAGCWGAYLSLVALAPTSDPAQQVTALARLAYAGEMITGFLLAACLAAVLRRRSAEA
ncbi:MULTISPECIES: hypothetical protein [Streptomyces]|uniref:LigA protein n=2 Tax=Streptomyces venezuelae TaxID=54571 RepID=F2RGJ5_STRVP|nr:hypothetical protein [Streptomyces venezuelae]APE20864.1 hypothetical protein vnz_07455 [Streptomyces venezuelae]QER98259.1 hypothetical protein DEJ43_07520 [Streptomyces venezuelae ATCC 10712]CCA54806.1 hypothetical protein SVEN_1519 [Streptomyces venezuelae ATCC 10712]